jgi:hypothetical protein
LTELASRTSPSSWSRGGQVPNLTYVEPVGLGGREAVAVNAAAARQSGIKTTL